MQFGRYRLNIFRGWTWLDFKNFRPGPLSYNSLFSSRFGHLSRSWHSFCTNFSFGSEENVDGWEKSINLIYKKQTFLSSNDDIIFMTKYGCLSYEDEWTKVFYPLFKSFLPPPPQCFSPPSYIFHLLKYKKGNSFSFFYEFSRVGKKLLKRGVKNFWKWGKKLVTTLHHSIISYENVIW